MKKQIYIFMILLSNLALTTLYAVPTDQELTKEQKIELYLARSERLNATAKLPSPEFLASMRGKTMNLPTWVTQEIIFRIADLHPFKDDISEFSFVRDGSEPFSALPKKVTMRFFPLNQQESMNLFTAITTVTSDSDLGAETIQGIGTLLAAANYPIQGDVEVEYGKNGTHLSIEFLPKITLL